VLVWESGHPTRIDIGFDELRKGCPTGGIIYCNNKNSTSGDADADRMEHLGNRESSAHHHQIKETLNRHKSCDIRVSQQPNCLRVFLGTFDNKFAVLWTYL
jgi:hypothetical protein